jgi:hypothetical protein
LLRISFDCHHRAGAQRRDPVIHFKALDAGGIDVEVSDDDSVARVGYQFGEIKPRTPSGEARFNRQLQEWGVGPVQAITYDAAGNVYYGFC